MDEVSAAIDKILENLQSNDAIVTMLNHAAALVESRYYSFPCESSGYTITVDPATLTLTASGDGVGFAEFGTGVYTSADSFAAYTPYGVYPGSYSESEGSGTFASRGFWYYKGQRYIGQQGTYAMQAALDYLQSELSNVEIV